MKKNLLHNIHNNDNENKSKIKTQDETCWKKELYLSSIYYQCM
jgi:hypothetical protein